MSGVVFVLALVVADAVEADNIADPHTISSDPAIALASSGLRGRHSRFGVAYKYALLPLMAPPLRKPMMVVRSSGHRSLCDGGSQIHGSAA